MAQQGPFYELTKSVKITGALPVDGARYLVANEGERLALASTLKTAFVGLQVFQANTKELWVAKEVDLTAGTSTWQKIAVGETSIDPSQILFTDLGDTPGTYTNNSDKILSVGTGGGIVFHNKLASDLLVTQDVINTLLSDATDKPLSAKQGKLLKAYIDGKEPKFTKNTAFNKNFPAVGTTGLIDISGVSKTGASDVVARADHDHAGIYYDKTEVDGMIISASKGIKYTWDTTDEMAAETGMVEGEQGLLNSTVGSGSPVICTGDTVQERAVYRWDTSSSGCWSFMYLMDAAHNHDGRYEPKNVNIQEHIAKIDGENPHNTRATDVTLGKDDSFDYLATMQVGGINAGDPVDNDTDVYTLLKDILAPVLKPTLGTSPNVVLGLDLKVPNVNVYEVGSSVSAIFKKDGGADLFITSFNKGTIINKSGPSTSDLVGNINGTVFSNPVGSGMPTDPNGTVSGVMPFGGMSYKVAANTLRGDAVYYDSNGATTTQEIEDKRDYWDNTDLVSSKTLYGGYYVYYGQCADINSIPTSSASAKVDASWKALFVSSNITQTVIGEKSILNPEAGDPVIDLTTIYTMVPKAQVPEGEVSLTNDDTRDKIFDGVTPYDVTLTDAGGTDVLYSVYAKETGGGFTDEQSLTLKIGTHANSVNVISIGGNTGLN